jgi:hypothetical protein
MKLRINLWFNRTSKTKATLKQVKKTKTFSNRLKNKEFFGLNNKGIKLTYETKSSKHRKRSQTLLEIIIRYK